MFSSFGDSFLDGPEMQAAKGPLIGGGLTQLTMIVVKKFIPTMAKHSALIGMAVGGGVSAYLMTKPQYKETGAAGLATALLIGLPLQLNTWMGGTLMGPDDLGAITSEQLSAYDTDMGAGPLELMDSPVQIQDSGSGSTGLIGAVTSEQMGAPAEDVVIQGSDFGATGL